MNTKYIKDNKDWELFSKIEEQEFDFHILTDFNPLEYPCIVIWNRNKDLDFKVIYPTDFSG